MGTYKMKKKKKRFKRCVAPQFEANVRMKLTLPKERTWSPPGLPKTQNLIAGVKIPCIEVFFILLEIS
jgi:hypothetical protein